MLDIVQRVYKIAVGPLGVVDKFIDDSNVFGVRTASRMSV